MLTARLRADLRASPIMCVQINGGNSGGPVFNKLGKCVGIAFQVRALRRAFPSHTTPSRAHAHDLLHAALR